jgi:hypothetical protein
MVDVQRRHGQVVMKPVCISEHNMFMKGVDSGGQYLAYYSLPRKPIKWTMRVALWLINCAIFNSFLVYKTLNADSKLKYKAFLMNVAKAWTTDKMEAAETESDTDLARPGPSTPTPRTSRVDPPGQLLGDVQNRPRKNCEGEHCKNKYHTRKFRVCTVHKRKRETQYICKFCLVPLRKEERFESYHTLKHF